MTQFPFLPLIALLGHWAGVVTGGASWERSDLAGTIHELSAALAAAEEDDPLASSELAQALDDAAGRLARGEQLESLLPVLIELAGKKDASPLAFQARKTRRVLERGLASAHGRELAQWLAVSVVPPTHEYPIGARALAAELLAAGGWRVALPALLSVARDAQDPLRPRVLRGLPSFADEAADLYLVGNLARPFDKALDPHPFNLVFERIRAGTPLGERAAQRLLARLAQMLLATDWREASRAVALSRGLEVPRSVPLLIDGLAAWDRRERLGVGSRRVSHELARELRRLSGRSIGADPKAWTTWWIAVRQGRVSLPAETGPPQAVEAGSAGEKGRTTASFFGLSPVSDHVTFVIDHSGSMTTEWGTRDHSRYVEAVDQMVRYLQAAGERTHFDVILFNDKPQRSTERMRLATPATLERLRSDLLARVPEGGTRLKPAVSEAMALSEAGQVDYERLQADTIIVLCDGETQEGPAWVAPLLERVGAESRIQFHCVLLGIRDDGVLEELARRTEGEFLRIGG